MYAFLQVYIFCKKQSLTLTKINKFGINQLLLNCSNKFHPNKIGNRHGYSLTARLFKMRSFLLQIPMAKVVSHTSL